VRIERFVRVGLLLVWFASSSCLAATRHYYIAAEDVTWNYAPSGHNLLNGNTVPQPWSRKLEWDKSRFIEYTDDTFTTRKRQPEWLGILGPIIRAEVGDEIVIDFLNRGRRGHNLHPQGLRYDKSNKPIVSLTLTSEMFLAPQDLGRPFNASDPRPIPFCPPRSKLLKSRGFVLPVLRPCWLGSSFLIR